MALFSQRQGAPTLDTLPPEIQQNIFGYLSGDNASLFAVIQVSKACHNFCIGMLWRKSTQRILARVPTPGRQQYYANMICKLKLDGNGSMNSFDGLEFPLLRSISLLGGSLPIKQLRRCLQTGLHTLCFSHCRLDPVILETMTTCCAQVFWLDVDHPDTSNITPDQFVNFLQSLSVLRGLRLNCLAQNIVEKLIAWQGTSVAQIEFLSWTVGWESSVQTSSFPNNFLKHCTGLLELSLDRGDLLSADALTQLSRLPALEILLLQAWLDDGVGEQLQEKFLSASSAEHPFPSIKRLSLCGSSPAIKTLLSNAPQTLVNLDLDITDNSDSICPTIGRLSNLVRLAILFDGYREFSRPDLDAISELSKLEKCYINWRGPLPMQSGPPSSNECPWLTDRYFKSWIAKLPRLRSLRLELNSTKITQSALQFLAESCPSLLKCELLWEHDLITWSTLKAPLFTHLKVLRLGRVKDHGYQETQATVDEDALRDIKVVRDLAPNLKTFLIGDTRLHSIHRGKCPYDTALIAAFRAGV